jgi:hypothetical protein
MTFDAAGVTETAMPWHQPAGMAILTGTLLKLGGVLRRDDSAG